MRKHNPFKSLSKFEIALWVVSVVIVSTSFLIVPSKDYLSLIASLIGVTALIFVAKGFVIGQILTVVFAVFYGIISFYFKYYGEMITYLFMTSPIAMLSVISWIKHPYKKSAEVTVNKMTKKQVCIMYLLALMTTVAFYFILNALGNKNLLFSTVSITTSFIASYLTLMRSPYYALAYAFNDIVLIVLWTLATAADIKYLPMIICFLMFLLNDAYGLYNWKRIEKRQHNDV